MYILLEVLKKVYEFFVSCELLPLRALLHFNAQLLLTRSFIYIKKTVPSCRHLRIKASKVGNPYTEKVCGGLSIYEWMCVHEVSFMNFEWAWSQLYLSYILAWLSQCNIKSSFLGYMGSRSGQMNYKIYEYFRLTRTHMESMQRYIEVFFWQLKILSIVNKQTCIYYSL